MFAIEFDWFFHFASNKCRTYFLLQTSFPMHADWTQVSYPMLFVNVIFGESKNWFNSTTQIWIPIIGKCCFCMDSCDMHTVASVRYFCSLFLSKLMLIGVENWKAQLIKLSINCKRIDWEKTLLRIMFYSHFVFYILHLHTQINVLIQLLT